MQRAEAQRAPGGDGWGPGASLLQPLRRSGGGVSLLRALWVGLLLLNTWKDLRHREIYPGLTLGAGFLAGILRIREGASLWELGAGLLPGVFFLGAAWISRGQLVSAPT